MELKETVEKIKEEDAYKLPEEEMKILKEMRQWLYPKGANYDKVKVVTQKKGYRGAIATKSIKVFYHKIKIRKTKQSFSFRNLNLLLFR